jgi:transposase
MKFSVPPGYVRKKPPAKPKLDAIYSNDRPHSRGRQVATEETAAYGEADLRAASGRTRLHRRHHDREGLPAGWRQRAQEMFVPLVHPPGHAQADFGEAIGIIGGVERKIHLFAFDLPHSDACFVVGYPAETTEAFCDGHVPLRLRVRRPRSVMVSLDGLITY